MVHQFTTVFLGSSFLLVQLLTASDDNCAAGLSRCDNSTQVEVGPYSLNQNRADVVSALMDQTQIAVHLRKRIKAMQALLDALGERNNELHGKNLALAAECCVLAERNDDLGNRVAEQESSIGFLKGLVQQEREEAFEEIANLQRFVAVLEKNKSDLRRRINNNL